MRWVSTPARSRVWPSRTTRCAPFPGVTCSPSSGSGRLGDAIAGGSPGTRQVVVEAPAHVLVGPEQLLAFIRQVGAAAAGSSRTRLDHRTPERLFHQLDGSPRRAVADSRLARGVLDRMHLLDRFEEPRLALPHHRDPAAHQCDARPRNKIAELHEASYGSTGPGGAHPPASGSNAAIPPSNCIARSRVRQSAMAHEANEAAAGCGDGTRITYSVYGLSSAVSPATSTRSSTPFSFAKVGRSTSA